MATQGAHFLDFVPAHAFRKWRLRYVQQLRREGRGVTSSALVYSYNFYWSCTLSTAILVVVLIVAIGLSLSLALSVAVEDQTGNVLKKWKTCAFPLLVRVTLPSSLTVNFTLITYH